MENKFKNEMEIKVAGETILLRPDFDNCAALESSHGSLAWLGWKFSRGMRDLKNMPGITDVVLLIYHMQAAVDPKDATKKLLSKEKCHELVVSHGMKPDLISKMIEFIARCTAGDPTSNEPSEGQKKS